MANGVVGRVVLMVCGYEDTTSSLEILGQLLTPAVTVLVAADVEKAETLWNGLQDCLSMVIIDDYCPRVTDRVLGFISRIRESGFRGDIVAFWSNSLTIQSMLDAGCNKAMLKARDGTIKDLCELFGWAIPPYNYALSPGCSSDEGIPASAA